MLPLRIIELGLVLFPTALQVVPVWFFIVFPLTDVPVDVIELIHGNDAEIISPEERLHGLPIV